MTNFGIIIMSYHQQIHFLFEIIVTSIMVAFCLLLTLKMNYRTSLKNAAVSKYFIIIFQQIKNGSILLHFLSESRSDMKKIYEKTYSMIEKYAYIKEFEME